MKNIVVVLLCAGLAACASAPRPSAPAATAPVVQAPRPLASTRDCSWYRPAEEDTSKRGDYVAGGLYRPDEKDRVPSAIPDVSCIPEPQVVALPRSKLGNKPVYAVLDKEYRVLDDTRGFAEEGLASYYGEKFHGRRTSNWEVYDMYAFSAAHKTLPLPSFARVTNVANGRSVVVRVNDRGPFHDGRVMDLSLAAAVKLGIYPAGTGHVRVEALQPGDAATGTTFASAPGALLAPMPVPGAGVPGPDVAARREAASATVAPVRVEPLPPPGAHATMPAASARGLERRAGGPNASAAHFEAWMRENQVRVATRPPGPVDERIASARSDALARPDASDSGRNVSADWSEGREPGHDAVMLQVASFSARDNAERALAALQGAGIAQARLTDAVARGQPIWRLRIGPVPANAEAELAARVRGLGFASPQRVRD